MLHLALFALVRPAPGERLSETRIPPDTHYLTTPPTQSTDARLIWSPLLFSLPSKMGFSYDLLQKKPRSPSPDLAPVELGNFLEVHLSTRDTERQIVPQELMLTTFGSPAPKLPAVKKNSNDPSPAARRVYVAPQLKQRLVGGIVLPPELNKTTDTAWEALASINVSGQGTVQHVFLDHPLESTEINSQILRLLYGLRFKPGKDSLDGRIEIYSSQKPNTGEGKL